jgi:hypothetical protein
MSTRVVMDENWSPASRPVYEDYFDYYFWGLGGQSSPYNQVTLQKVCMDQKIQAVKRFKNPEDIFLSVVTLGIYSPMTVQVWCGD